MKQILDRWTCSAVLAGISLVTLPALAQEVETVDTGNTTPVAQEKSENRLPITVNAGVSEQFKSDVDHDSGKFSLTRVKVGVGVPIRVCDAGVLATAFKYDMAAYNFSDGVGNGPWQDIHTFVLASILQWKFDDTWSFYGGGVLKTSAESGADFGSAFTGGGIVGVNYAYSETLTFGCGLAVISQIEDDATILPLPTANWKFADDWSLRLGFVDVASQGYGLETAWELNKEWTFSFGAQAHKSRFRIQGTGASNDGVGQERSTVLFAGATWHATPKIDVNGFLGIAAGGKIRLEDENGHKLADESYDPTPVIGMKASIRL